MARRPKPWYRKDRDAWFVTIDGKRHNLGPDKDEAFDRFYRLMAQPQQRSIRSDSLVTMIDAFLDWTHRNRSADTYEWYRYRLQRFAERYPALPASELRPFHVQRWVDSYELSTTSRRNYLRTVKRCMKWATDQGYIDKNPIVSLEVPAADRKEVVITPSEYRQLLDLIRNDAFRDLIITTWETGSAPTAAG